MKNLSLPGMAVLMATTLNAYGGGSDILNTTDDKATVAQGDSVTIDVLANDTGTDLYVFDASDVWTGSFSITDNKIVYNASGKTGVTELWYGVEDAYDEESWSKVTITITGDDKSISSSEIRTSLKGNRCASVWDADVGNGARTVLWDCAPGGAPSQQYSFVPYGDFPNEYRVKAQHSGKCLAVAERGNGEIVQQWACKNTAKNAIWKLEPQSEGYRLRNKLSNRCMAVWDGDPGKGTKLVQWDCADSQNMTFEIELSDVTIPNDIMDIWISELRTSLKGNRCASVWDADVGNGARTVLWDCAPGGAPSQQYSFVPYGDIYNEYRVKAQHSGKCLAVAERGNGEIVQQWACEDTAKNAIWKLEPQSEGYRLRNKLSNRCMAVWDGDPGKGTKLVQWDCADSQNMTFEINDLSLIN